MLTPESWGLEGGCFLSSQMFLCLGLRSLSAHLLASVPRPPSAEVEILSVPHLPLSTLNYKANL